MEKNMGVQWGCVGDNLDSAVGKSGGSSTMAIYLPKKEKKQMGSYLVKIS